MKKQIKPIIRVIVGIIYILFALRLGIYFWLSYIHVGGLIGIQNSIMDANVPCLGQRFCVFPQGNIILSIIILEFIRAASLLILGFFFIFKPQIKIVILISIMAVLYNFINFLLLSDIDYLPFIFSVILLNLILVSGFTELAFTLLRKIKQLFVSINSFFSHA